VHIPGQPADRPAPVQEWEDAIDLAGHTLRDLLNLLGLTETEIRARVPETAGDGAGRTEQVFDIVALDENTADELGGLIGRRGQTLTSLQYLVNVIAARRLGGDHVFTVDVEGYRQRRERSLVQMAHEIADEVRESGDVITLEPLPAAERRIIHLVIEAEEGVRSESVGDGEDRQVEVLPE
jgi:spoIIIJ-associated protein